MAAQEGPAPDQRADTGDQDHDTGQRPEDILRRRQVADQRLRRPVVGIGGDRARPFGGRRPGRPEEEVGQRRALGGAGQRILLHRVIVAHPPQRGIVAIELVVMAGNLGDGAGAPLRNRDHAGLRIQAVVPVFLLQRMGERRFLLEIERIERRAVFFRRRQPEPGRQLAVQPVRRPVGRLIGAMPPDRTQLHTAGALPGRLPGHDVVMGHQHLARGGNDLGGDGRRLTIDLDSRHAQYDEGHGQDRDQEPPKLAIFAHYNPHAPFTGQAFCRYRIRQALPLAQGCAIGLLGQYSLFGCAAVLIRVKAYCE